MSNIETKAAFQNFVADVEGKPGYVRPRAFGVGITTLSNAGVVLDTWYPFPNYEGNYGTAAVLADLFHYGSGHLTVPNISVGHIERILQAFAWCENDGKSHGNVEALKKIQQLLLRGNGGNAVLPARKTGVVCFIPPGDQDEGANKSVSDAYLRLHLLSHRLVKPHGIKLDGIFGTLPNNYWTNEGPVSPDDMLLRRFEAGGDKYPLLVHSLDKFPRMLDYVTPSGIRIADANRVRLGAYLGVGTTIMHEGFCNFNAGTEGPNMIEGRISAGVFLGADTDIGGGASIMGTLSGGGKEVIAIGKHCLVGANGGTGISLGDYCTIEAGLYVTASMKVVLDDGSIVKAGTLSGGSEMRFIRESDSGVVRMSRRKNSVELNKELHKNT